LCHLSFDKWEPQISHELVAAKNNKAVLSVTQEDYERYKHGLLTHRLSFLGKCLICRLPPMIVDEQKNQTVHRLHRFIESIDLLLNCIANKEPINYLATFRKLLSKQNSKERLTKKKRSREEGGEEEGEKTQVIHVDWDLHGAMRRQTHENKSIASQQREMVFALWKSITETTCGSLKQIVSDDEKTIIAIQEFVARCEIEIARY
jgi:hypothetical protein